MKSCLAGTPAGDPSGRKKAWPLPDFCDVTRRMAQITEERNRLLASAFDLLEVRYGVLAQALVQVTGGRAAAARWMCAHHKAFGGLTAYDLIGEGDVDQVWDNIQI